MDDDDGSDDAAERRIGLLSEAMAVRGAAAGLLLLAAGLDQLAPMKGACLQHRRLPVDRLVKVRHEGIWAMFNVGMRYGSYCLGCCSSLMALMFVGGAMNVVYMVAIALSVLAERILPWGRTARLVGALLMARGSISLTLAVL